MIHRQECFMNSITAKINVKKIFYFSAAQSLIIIGVVVGVGGLLILAAGFFAFRLVSARRERKRRDE